MGGSRDNFHAYLNSSDPSDSPQCHGTNDGAARCTQETHSRGKRRKFQEIQYSPGGSCYSRAPQNAFTPCSETVRKRTQEHIAENVQVNPPREVSAAKAPCQNSAIKSVSNDPDELLAQLQPPSIQPKQVHLLEHQVHPDSRISPLSQPPPFVTPHQLHQPYMKSGNHESGIDQVSYPFHGFEAVTINSPTIVERAAAYESRFLSSQGDTLSQGMPLSTANAPPPSTSLAYGANRTLYPTVTMPIQPSQNIDESRVGQLVDKFVSEHPAMIAVQRGLQSLNHNQQDHALSLEIVLRKLDAIAGDVTELKDRFMSEPTQSRQVSPSSVAECAEDSIFGNALKFLNDKHDEKVRSALSLTCTATDSGCKVLEDQRFCPAALLWAKALTRLPRKTSGAYLGNYISDLLRDNKSVSHCFYPNIETFFECLFLPSVRNACGDLTNAQLENLKQFYNRNKDFLDSFLRSSLQGVHGTRKNEFMKTFVEHDPEVPPKSYFLTAASINAGSYRRTEESPVGLPRFVGAVKWAFRVGSNENVVTLQQLAFASTSLIRAYTSANIVPALYELVPGGSSSQIDYKEKKRMHGLMCAALAKRLMSTYTKTGTAWKLGNLQIVNIEGEGTCWLQEFTSILGDTDM